MQIPPAVAQHHHRLVRFGWSTHQPHSHKRQTLHRAPELHSSSLGMVVQLGASSSGDVHGAFHDNAQQVLQATSQLNSEGIWIFGFGSLIYKPGFDFVRSVDGYIRSWRRVWHQGSTDHRGTQEYPGRTVTLQQDAAAVTWGRAFLLSGTREQQLETLKYLEWREKQYDVRAQVDVYHAHDPVLPAVQGALVYIASPDRQRNVNYIGPSPMHQLAQQVSRAVGPSGPNYDYLYRLADAMRQMGAEDEELFELERRVRGLLDHASAGPMPLLAAQQHVQPTAPPSGAAGT